MVDGTMLFERGAPGEDVCLTVRRMMEAVSYTVISCGCMEALEAQLGGWKRAMDWLTAQSVELGRPVGINIDMPGGTSQTIFLAPGWNNEKLLGWLGVAGPWLEEVFGPIAKLTDVAIHHESKGRHLQDANENDKGET